MLLNFLFSSIFTGLSHSAKCHYFCLKVEQYIFILSTNEFDLLRDCVLCWKLHSVNSPESRH